MSVKDSEHKRSVKKIRFKDDTALEEETVANNEWYYTEEKQEPDY